MKFCFELVSCWGSSATSRSTDRTPAPSVDETRSLVTSLSRQRRIRRKRSLPTSSPSAEWKPSLCSISEDKVVAERTVGSDRAVKRKSSGPTSSRVHVRYVSDDYGYLFFFFLQFIHLIWDNFDNCSPFLFWGKHYILVK